MAIADELTKLETNRANIVAAINSKGGKLAENAGLAACPEAISQLGGAGETTLWTGHVDEAGLRYIGWDDTDIANLKANICWNEEDDADYAVPQDHKDLWDACKKVVVNGRTMLDYSEIGRWINYEFKLKYLPMINCLGVKSFSFGICKWLISIPLLDTSAVTNMYNMFNGCVSLITIPLLDTSAVTNMGGMFNGCASLITIPLLDTSAVTDMYSMFNGCASLITIPLLDTSAVTNMSGMFLNCLNLKKVPRLNVESVTNMWNHFGGCVCLETVEYSNINKDADYTILFNGCASLRVVNIAFKYIDKKADGLYRGSSIEEILNDDMSKATFLNQLISGCKYVKKLRLNFTGLCENVGCMFDGPRYIKELSFGEETSLAGITSANGMMARSNATSIPKTCVTYTMCTQLFNTMLRGIPNYTADSYPMYFENGSTVTDDAAGTLQSLVEQCQAMGWAIYNLTINPYTE